MRESLFISSREVRFKVGWDFSKAMQHAIAKRLGIEPGQVVEAWCEPVFEPERGYMIASMRIAPVSA